MAPAIAPSTPRLPANAQRPDDPLPELLRRLLQPTLPVLADLLLTRPPGESDAALLEFVAARSTLRARRIAGAAELAALAPRVLCIPAQGRALLLEAGADGWTLATGGTDGRVPVDAAWLDGLCPCAAWFLAGAGTPQVAAARRRQAAGTGPGVALRLAAQVLGMALPVAMMLIIDKVVSEGASDTLRALLVGVALLTAFQYLFLWLQAINAARGAELDGHGNRGRVFSELLASRDGPRCSALGWDVLQSCAESARFGAETRPQCLADCVFVALLAALMAAFSPSLLAVTVAFVPAYLALEAWGRRRTADDGARLTNLRGALSRRYLEAVAAVDVIRGLHLADYVAAHWRARDADLAEVRYRMTIRRRQAGLAVEFLQKISVLCIMLLGVGAVIDGTMTLGQYIAFNLLSMQLAQPVMRLAAFRRALADEGVRDRARRRLQQRCRGHGWPEAGSLRLPDREQPSLQVSGVLVGDPAAARMRPLSFALLGGGWLGISGRSGSGKSTLLRALAGLERPSRGRIRLNGIDIRRLARDGLALRVRLVPQEPVIFSTSIAENIRFGDPAAAPGRILAVAELCGLTPLLAGLPEHLNTVVGAGGRALSGGERQRLALARALLSRPDVLLLDEATSALDEAAEARLLGNVRGFLPRAAVVLVAHRAASLLGCRQVIVLGPEPGTADSMMPAAGG